MLSVLERERSVVEILSIVLFWLLHVSPITVIPAPLSVAQIALMSAGTISYSVSKFAFPASATHILHCSLSYRWLMTNKGRIFIEILLVRLPDTRMEGSDLLGERVKTIFSFKDGAYYCYCAYVLRISRYSDFLSPMLTNTGIFLRSLKLSRESRS